MKRTFIWSDMQVGFGEVREAELVIVAGEVVKNRNGAHGIKLENPVVVEDENQIQITFKKIK